MDRLALALATGLSTGYISHCPGTWGTLLAFPIHLFLARLPLAWHLAALGAILTVAITCAGMVEKIVDQPDPSIVVIDEVIGMLTGLVLAPLTPAAFLAGFFIFRFFDILKPFPVGWLDSHLHGGAGIVLDDVMAGIYTFACLQLIFRLLL